MSTHYPTTNPLDRIFLGIASLLVVSAGAVAIYHCVVTSIDPPPSYEATAGGILPRIYGDNAVEARYPLAKTDGTGRSLDGSKHNYTLTFAKDQFPPVNAFWSVTGVAAAAVPAGTTLALPVRTYDYFPDHYVNQATKIDEQAPTF